MHLQLFSSGKKSVYSEKEWGCKCHLDTGHLQIANFEAYMQPVNVTEVVVIFQQVGSNGFNEKVK